MKKHFVFCGVFLLFLLLSACSPAAVSSSPVSPSSLYEDVFEPEESLPAASASLPSPSAFGEPAPSPSPSLSAQPSLSQAPIPSESVAASDPVFWVPNGKVYHSTKSCDSLSRSKTIKSGSVEEAKAAGKSRGCKRCF